MAVKQVPIYSTNTKDIENEIRVLQSIKHKNFINLIGVCKEIKRINLITDYFEGMSLTDLIHGEPEIKRKYNFDMTKKHSIAVQICSAMTFLQLRENAILHRDLKPENVLVNVKGLIKVCDFGLSKFSIMVTKLQSTVARLKGTLPYMAPEVVLRQGEASIFSEAWSLACVILELFQETLIWPDDIFTEEKLKELMESGGKPDTSKVPPELDVFLFACFSYVPHHRPIAVNILEYIKKCNYLCE